MSRRERVAQRDAQANEPFWGMGYAPDTRTASPERLAYEAYERGDRIFKIELLELVVQGNIGVGTTATRNYRPAPYDIGTIEAQGWHLEHVGVTFIEHGSSATKRLLANVGSTEVTNHGALVGLYVFRRVESAQPRA